MNGPLKASIGWLENFKKRRNIIFLKICSENASVDASSCEDWLAELPSALKDSKADDLFNTDETGLFFHCLPNKTAAFKGEECLGGKQCNLHVTALGS
ncbi:hypothetical protein AVEN_216254-1 [Araneus ventricosus]|uniref:HTH CENPB-type domain-containing protein n=1 Tax=Araneus ventricosus TaxID=182803 RepID=A0A4Y2HQW6_ARAVE|nr:hypothetical protein AVEN_216254-1 [Araneus ventricosus]